MYNDRPIPRVDPRRPYVIGPSGLKRIVLGENVGSRDPQAIGGHGHQAKPVRSSGPFARRLMVVAHTDRGALDEAAREALAAAAILAGKDTEVVALLFGAKADTAEEQARAAGVDRLICTVDPGFAPECKLAWLSAIWELEAPEHVFFADRGADADLGRRFACRQKLSVASDVVEIASGEARRRVPDGRFAVHKLPQVMLLARKVADTRLPFVGLGKTMQDTTLPTVDERIRDLGTQASPASQLALEEADLILSAGNGVQHVETFKALAEAMGAATGASRVAVDDGRFPRAMQVGATGKTVQASAYIALGISGAVQHLQGIKDCRHVIAVNLDASAAIAKRADLTIVDDCQSFMQALLKLVNEARAGKEKAA
ncbi:electron transfer flavoprotein subunit alpha/FixB family protein [Crenobacter sp. SG2305]|uniref:electron transfer flavoprotein subunit alpha/FixB family protein n=1 Tax=Crenobacter oryzisoli TaxID=3056844 RepID=UPI0025AB131F|nr:electron transfer flavoprotein subunit alpha/FixB family protein [Crenobacter sp. SG2305]MDN0085324.1 electron transfer flavoprotein subunit alpha/FixB family protein [Crenobacter sp. SG2305]